ncbi:hypothetical protein TNCV_1218831 [Trichonephila clavipes]|nr:hypothetical protein TNCV_1218831 [Trichonephila clavipes]
MKIHPGKTRSYIQTAWKSSDRGSLVVKVTDSGLACDEFEPVSLKNHRAGKQCTLNLSRAQASSRWCGVLVRRGDASSGVILVP